MRNEHPDKSIMFAEIGKTKDSYQQRWLSNAFRTIKLWPGIKAAIYWNSSNMGLGDNHHLSPESWETLEEILKDKYFIGGIITDKSKYSRKKTIYDEYKEAFEILKQNAQQKFLR